MDDRYPKLKIYVSEIILGRHYSIPTALPVGGSRDLSPVTGGFFWGIRLFHVPWGRLSL